MACYASSSDEYGKGTGAKHPVIGWIEKVVHDSHNGVVYYICWSDRQNDTRDRMPVREEQIGPLKKLVDQIRSGEIK